MSFIKRIATSVLGGKPEDEVLAELQGASVPVTDAPCRTCANPCDEGHVEYTRMMVDTLTDMRGSVKPYHRQVVISTGKADWPKEVTDVNGSLAQHLSTITSKLGGGGKKHKKHASSPAQGRDDKNASKPPKEPPTGPGPEAPSSGSNSNSNSKSKVAGVLSFEGASRTSVLNGSHRSVADDDAQETVLVLPDYVAVANVPASADGAEALWLHALVPDVPRAGTVRAAQELRSWTLPYHCLILLCSHKTRDMRCHIAAKRLEEDFMGTLQSEGWHVDTDLEDLSSTGTALEDFPGTDEEREKEAIRRLKALDEEPTKRALIIKNSHIGGHKFAGNVVLYFPQGSSVWYGRVSSHEVRSVVKNTILAGKILPPLLRGGINISRPGCENLLTW